ARRILAVVVAGDRQHRHGARALVRAKLTAQLDPVDAGHGNIGEDEIRTQLFRLLERLESVVSLLGAEALVRQRDGVVVPRFGVVFDHEDEWMAEGVRPRIRLAHGSWRILVTSKTGRKRLGRGTPVAVSVATHPPECLAQLIEIERFLQKGGRTDRARSLDT